MLSLSRPAIIRVLMQPKQQMVFAKMLSGYSARRFAATVAPAKVLQKEAPVLLSKISFEDTKSIYSKLKTSELVASGLMLSSMRLTFIFQNANFLLNMALKVFGRTLVFAAVRHTLFNQFAGGETLEQLMVTGKFLGQRGLGTIVDCAIEAEDNDTGGPSDAWMDSNLKATLDGIHHSSILRDARKTDFAFLALKITCLCPPHLLRSVTACLNTMHWLFAFGTNVVSDPKKICIHSPQYHDVLLSKVFPKKNVLELFQSLWPKNVNTEAMYDEMVGLPGGNSNEDGVTYIQWASYFSPEKIGALPSPGIPGNSELTKLLADNHWLSPKDLDIWDVSMKRVHQCFEDAVKYKVRLLVDAEQTFYQTAIDWVAIKMSEKYCKLIDSNDPNASNSFAYNTHQLYLKNSFGKLKYEAARADALGYKFGSKVVRGAYMFQEARCAKEKNYECMVHNSVEDTCDSYNKGVNFMLSALPKYELLLGSHNEESIKIAAQELGKLVNDDAKKYPVTFAQLFGMCDYISLQLAKAGARSYKYTPYGSVENVLPYLVRRAEENSSIFGGARKESQLVWKEVRRRMFGFL